VTWIWLAIFDLFFFFFFSFSFFFLNQARKHILQIHTRDWNPRLSDPFLEELAEKSVGEC